MDRTHHLHQDYEWITWVIRKLVDGVQHEESILQLPFPTNCLNWILGHILAGRNTAIKLLNGEPIWDDELLALYQSGSEPIREGSKAHPWESLVKDLDDSQRRINNALEMFSEDQMDEVVETDRGLKPVWQHVSGYHWHETYHVGQVEILSQYAQSSR